jgi:hypothetical protein
MERRRMKRKIIYAVRVRDEGFGSFEDYDVPVEAGNKRWARYKAEKYLHYSLQILSVKKWAKNRRLDGEPL